MNIDQLKEKIGKDKVLIEKEDRLAFSYDASREQYYPDCVVMAESVQDVVETMKFADANNIKVYPRGAGTGQTGGSVPTEGGIALVLTKMDKILEIDRDNLTATVEPGVVLEKLNDEVAKFGLLYPPDPASAKAATMGGTIAECSGGLRGVKYGVTRDYVLKLEVVTIDGQVLNFGAATMKSVTAYDIVRLIIGSEGTMCVVTKITVKLVPAPSYLKTLLAVFNDETTALNCASDIIKYPLLPAVLEFMDEKTIDCSSRYSKSDLLLGAKSVLLIELDGTENSVSTEYAILEGILKKNNCVNIMIAADEDQREELWEVRKSLSPALFLVAPSKKNEDICVPRSRLAETLTRAKAIEKKYNLNMIAFAHAGDGNIHINFMCDDRDKDEMERVEKAVEEIFELAIEVGGTLSGEHGIGITKSKYIPLEIGAKEMELMKKIKAVWDPKNLLNPHKIFPIN